MAAANLLAQAVAEVADQANYSKRDKTLHIHHSSLSANKKLTFQACAVMRVDPAQLKNGIPAFPETKLVLSTA